MPGPCAPTIAGCLPTGSSLSPSQALPLGRFRSHPPVSPLGRRSSARSSTRSSSTASTATASIRARRRSSPACSRARTRTGPTYPQSQSVIPAETNPNHTAMMSGAFPGRSGIPANAFALYAPLADEDACVTTGPLDFSVMPTETSGESATCPLAEMTFEAIKRQGNPDELATAGIFGKPKLGRIFAGQNVKRGRVRRRLPVGAMQQRRRGRPLLRDRANQSDHRLRGRRQGGDGPSAGIDRTESRATSTPGGPTSPSSTCTRSTAPAMPPAPAAVYDSAISLADAEIERLVTALRQRGEWERTVLILVSDHSMDSTTDKVSAHRRAHRCRHRRVGVPGRQTTAASTSSTLPTAPRPRASSCWRGCEPRSWPSPA